MPEIPDLTPIENDKLKIDPDFDFREVGQRAFQDLTTNEIGMFKWSGVYHQLQKGFFMIRLRVPGGLLTAEQLERAADLAETYGQADLCITTRQCLQFHWIRKEDIHKVIEGMEEVGILTRNACGDVSRNVVSCSLQGVCPHEIGETRPMLEAIANDDAVLNKQRNLPRKHKISVSGCGRACGQTLMNCQSWHPVTRPRDDGTGEETGWYYYAGGGLGARPYMAKAIFGWVPEALVTAVTSAATEVYRREGNRRKRGYARLKVVVDNLGARGFGEAVLEVLQERGVAGREAIEFAASPRADIGDMFLDGQPVVPQKQKGFNVVRAVILRSELSSKAARLFAGWARDYGNGQVMLTNRQNIELRFVPDERVDALTKEIERAGFTLDGHERLPDMVACVGTTQCNLAVSDTPNTYRRLYREFVDDRALWEKVGPLRIHMNGCPNSCAQHWIADIGLRGTRLRNDGGSDEGFGIFVGGSLAGAGHIAEYVCDVSGSKVPETLRRMLDVYLDQRVDEAETFGAFARRVGGARIQGWLSGAPALLADQPVNLRNQDLHDVFQAALVEAESNDG